MSDTLPPLPEPAAHMYPSDLERFQADETFAHAYSVAVGSPDERSVPLFTLSDMVKYADERAAAAVAEPGAIHQWRTIGCADWYDGHPDHGDGGGPYETRTLYAAPPQRDPQWVPVAERLPEKFTEVLVAFAGQMSIASTGQYTNSPHDTNGWCYPAENNGICDDGSDPVVTHWMPLPDAPASAPKEQA